MSRPVRAVTTAPLHAVDLDRDAGLKRMVADFHRDGFAVMEQAVAADELAALRADTAELIAEGPSHRDDLDFFFARDADGERFHRVQYIFPKGSRGSLLDLAGNPRLLAVVEAILGPDFLCAGEALVFKAAGDGRVVPMHTDCNPAGLRSSHVFFNLDVYLDDSDLENGCLWVAPGSHRDGEDSAAITAQGFAYPGLQPVPVRAGDVIVHNTRLVHGSQPSRSSRLRRTLYFEFHDRSEILAEGYPQGRPLPPGWAENRQRILHRAIARRAAWAAHERPFPYRPATPPPAVDEKVELRPRLGHSQYV